MARKKAMADKGEQYQALRLECNLMIFHRYDCQCSEFWARNGSHLIPGILDIAEKKMIDPLEYFADYAREIHAKHQDNDVIYT